MNAINDEGTMKMNDDRPMGQNSPEVYTLDAIPSGVDRHLHRCPVEACGHELMMVLSNGEVGDRGSRSYRWSLDENSMPVKELLRVRMPNSCWCGAPLPGAEEKTFGLLDVKTMRLLSKGTSVLNDDPPANLEYVAILESVEYSPSELSNSVSQEGFP